MQRAVQDFSYIFSIRNFFLNGEQKIFFAGHTWTSDEQTNVMKINENSHLGVPTSPPILIF